MDILSERLLFMAHVKLVNVRFQEGRAISASQTSFLVTLQSIQVEDNLFGITRSRKARCKLESEWKFAN